MLRRIGSRRVDDAKTHDVAFLQETIDPQRLRDRCRIRTVHADDGQLRTGPRMIVPFASGRVRRAACVLKNRLQAAVLAAPGEAQPLAVEEYLKANHVYFT